MGFNCLQTTFFFCGLLTVVTAVQLQSHGNLVAPSRRVDANEAGDDGRVEAVDHHAVAVGVSLKELQEESWEKKLKH